VCLAEGKDFNNAISYRNKVEVCSSSSPLLEQKQMTPTDQFLEAAIQEARQGLAEGGIPIGSVIG